MGRGCVDVHQVFRQIATGLQLGTARRDASCLEVFVVVGIPRRVKPSPRSRGVAWVTIVPTDGGGKAMQLCSSMRRILRGAVFRPGTTLSY